MGNALGLVCLLVVGLANAAGKPFYLSIDAPPAPELTPAQALASFSLAPGFSVELVAAEPMVEDPVAITWDEAGRLYVVEMRGYMPDAFGNNEKDPVGYVVRLTDTNDDGVFDKRQVLLDKLVLPRAIAIINEGLLVGEPPNLWLCPSTTGRSRDIDCANKRRLGAYGDQPGSVEHAENGLLTGIDNWLYSAKSNRRLQVRDGQLVVEPTLFRGQWGIAQDNDGRLYYNTNSNLLLADAYDGQQVVVAGNASAPGLGARVSKHDELFAARVNPGVNRAYVPGVLKPDGRLNGPTSASGMVVYRGDTFPLANREDVFIAEPAANAVVQLRLNQRGLTIESQHLLYPHQQWQQVEFFASTDERFRPVDVKLGPDGALYVVDFYRGIIQDHYFLSEQLRAQALARSLDKPLGLGRIWRIRASNEEAVRRRPNLASAGGQMLLDQLGHANAWQRQTAQRLLLAKSGTDIDRKLKASVKHGPMLQAVHALYTLAGRSTLDAKTVRRALVRKEPAVHLAAARAGASTLARKDILKLLKASHDAVLVQQLILSLAPHNDHPTVRQYLVRALLANAADPYRPSAIKAAAHTQEVELLQALHATGAWNALLEEQTDFVQALVTQGLRADPDAGLALLDYVHKLATHERWLQVAILNGLFDVSRHESFERVLLAKAHGLFSATDERLWPSIARARRAFTWPGDELAANAKPLSPAQQLAKAKGAAFYTGRCAACHGGDGNGIASLAPALAGSPWVTESSERLLRILLHGMQGPIEVAGTTWNGVMPGHGAQPEFTDEVASGLMTYLHRAWGHNGRAINPDFVAQVRKETANRSKLWTTAELETLDTNTHYQRYVGRYGSPDFGLEFVYNGHGLEVKSGIFNGPLVEQKEDHFLFEPRHLAIEFVLDDAGRAIALRVPSGDGVAQLPRLP